MNKKAQGISINIIIIAAIALLVLVILSVLVMNASKTKECEDGTTIPKIQECPETQTCPSGEVIDIVLQCPISKSFEITEENHFLPEGNYSIILEQELMYKKTCEEIARFDYGLETSIYCIEDGNKCFCSGRKIRICLEWEEKEYSRMCIKYDINYLEMIQIADFERLE